MRWLPGGGQVSLPSLLVYLAASTISTPPTSLVVTWLIDGNNVKCSRGVPDDRNAMIEELQKIASPKLSQTMEISTTDRSKSTNNPPEMIANVILVFDGDHNETLEISVSQDLWFQVVITDGFGGQKDRADNYIIDKALLELQLPPSLGGVSTSSKVHLVSADKELGKRAAATRRMGGGSIVHPPKFWKQYLPNLQERQERLRASGAS